VTVAVEIVHFEQPRRPDSLYLLDVLVENAADELGVGVVFNLGISVV